MKWGFGKKWMERGLSGLSGFTQINTNYRAEVGIWGRKYGTRIERIERINADKYKQSC